MKHRYCLDCGSKAYSCIPEGDDRERLICSACGYIHYENPRIVSGCIPVLGEKILLARRSIQPRYGLWTFPSGFMELGESPGEGARREALEECCCEVQIEELIGVFSILHIGHIYMVYRARLPKSQFAPGDESLECRLFEPQDIPWEELAFSAVSEALDHYVTHRHKALIPILHTSFTPKPG